MTSFIHSFSSVTQHARHAHAQVTRETHHKALHHKPPFLKCGTQRTCPPALREPPRSLFLLPLTCVGPDTWLPLFLCRRRPLRFGTRLGEGVLSEGGTYGLLVRFKVFFVFLLFFLSVSLSLFLFILPERGAGNPNCHVVFSLRAKLVMVSVLDFCVFVHSALLGQSPCVKTDSGAAARPRSTGQLKRLGDDFFEFSAVLGSTPDTNSASVYGDTASAVMCMMSGPPEELVSLGVERLSDIVRDVTEKRWYFDFFHDTELAAEVAPRAARSTTRDLFPHKSVL